MCFSPRLLTQYLLISLTLVSPPLLAQDSPISTWLQQTTWPQQTQEAPPFTGKPLAFKFGHPAPPASLLPAVYQKAFDWLDRYSNHHIVIKQYGGGTLYGAKSGFKAIRSGIADMGNCYTITEAKGFEYTKTFQVPFVAPKNPILTARIIAELSPKYLKPEFERRRVHMGAVATSRPLSLMSKMPIRTPEDLKGKKVVSFITTPGAAEALQFTQVQMPFPEIYTALQQGVIDAVIWVDMGFIPFKIYEQAPYYSAVELAGGTLETCINPKSFSRLPKPWKQVVHDMQQKLAMAMTEKTENFSISAEGILKQQGVTLITLTEGEKAQWQQRFQPVREQWFKRCEDAGKNCRQLVKDIDRLAEKYKALSNNELMQLTIDQPVQGLIDF